MNQIDYSEIKLPEAVSSGEEWEPPVHKYFGKKLANGKTEKEPVYTYQEFPRMVYAQNGESIKARVVSSAEELARLGDGWELTPAKFGYIGAPSFEEHIELQNKKVDVETVKRGRPAKAE